MGRAYLDLSTCKESEKHKMVVVICPGCSDNLLNRSTDHPLLTSAALCHVLQSFQQLQGLY